MTDFSKIPSTPHFAIITQNSVHIPGDERSRTHPGHGYPAETMYYISYDVYTDKIRWEAEITSLTMRKEKFKAMEVNPAKIETTVTVKVG